MSKKIKIIIATHKKYTMPEDAIYLPLHVGKEGKEDLGYTGDNTGDHISQRNASFCELTGLYWGWKNLECDYMGLAHYRRHFSVKKKSILTEEEVAPLLSQYDILVPKKRKYYIETLYSHYSNTHYKEHLDITQKIIEEKYPEYLQVYEAVMKQRSGYMFNMYIMPKELSDRYCAWLFDILFELEKRIGTPELSQFQGRFYGRVSEIIFNVWLQYQVQQHQYTVKEIGYLHMEKTNWFKKGGSFLMAKFFHKKYTGSF